MDKIKKQKRIPIELGVFLLVIFGFLVVAWRSSESEPTFDEKKVREVDAIWYGDGQPQGVDSLPEVFDCDEEGTTNVYTTISEEWLEQGNTICFRASQEAVQIWIDGTLMLEQGNREFTILGEAPSSGWVMLRLPADSVGKELRIELSSPYENYQGLLNKVYIGTKAALLFFIMHTYGLGFALAVLLIIMSVILLFVLSFILCSEVIRLPVLFAGRFWVAGRSLDARRKLYAAIFYRQIAGLVHDYHGCSAFVAVAFTENGGAITGLYLLARLQEQPVFSDALSDTFDIASSNGSPGFYADAKCIAGNIICGLRGKPVFNLLGVFL